MCGRFCPAPLGIVLWCSKLEFGEGSQGIEQHCHSEPVRTLVWESPSNSRQPIVIQTVLFAPFSGVHPREIVLLSRRLPRQCELLYRNDREFNKFQFRDQLTKRRLPDSCFFLFFCAFPFLANKSGFLPEKGGILLRDLNSSGRKLSFLLIIFKKSLQSERYVIYYCDQAMVFTK